MPEANSIPADFPARMPVPPKNAFLGAMKNVDG
jgi:hypothetical protein